MSDLVLSLELLQACFLPVRLDEIPSANATATDTATTAASRFQPSRYSLFDGFIFAAKTQPAAPCTRLLAIALLFPENENGRPLVSEREKKKETISRADAGTIGLTYLFRHSRQAQNVLVRFGAAASMLMVDTDAGNGDGLTRWSI